MSRKLISLLVLVCMGCMLISVAFAGEFKTEKGKTYYYDDAGNVVTGWVQTPDGWVFTSSVGIVQTGLVKINGKVYYFDPETKLMATGKVTINGVEREFGADGSATRYIPGQSSIRSFTTASEGADVVTSNVAPETSPNP